MVDEVEIILISSSSTGCGGSAGKADTQELVITSGRAAVSELITKAAEEIWVLASRFRGVMTRLIRVCWKFFSWTDVECSGYHDLG